MLAIDFYSLCHTLKTLDTSPESLSLMWQGVLNRDPQAVLLIDSKPYWRTKVYPEYKGNRDSTPLEGSLIESGRSLGLPVLMMDGLEADDWAGLMALSKKVRQLPGVLRFLTVDTDWLQLVDDDLGIEWENLGIHSPSIRRSQEVLDWAFNRHKVWIPHPSYVGKMKRVMGDKVDNIPPNHPLPLTELMGDEWLEALEGAGYVLADLLSKVEEVYP